MKPANRQFTTLLTVGRKVHLQILTNLGDMGNLFNCLTKLLLIKQRIKREIIHLLHKIINRHVDNKGLMK